MGIWVKNGWVGVPNLAGAQTGQIFKILPGIERWVRRSVKSEFKTRKTYFFNPFFVGGGFGGCPLGPYYSFVMFPLGFLFTYLAMSILYPLHWFSPGHPPRNDSKTLALLLIVGLTIERWLYY